jgi:hypothetical protein
MEDMEESDLIVNWKGERSRGWGGWAEKGDVDETFRFACPNNPAVSIKLAIGRRRPPAVKRTNGIDETLSAESWRR